MAGGGRFVINDHTAKAGQPGEGTLNEPAPGQRHEAALREWPTTDLPDQAQTQQMAREAPTVGCTGEHHLQASRLPRTVRQQGQRAGAVVAVSRVHVRSPDAPAGINQNLAFAAVDELVGIQAAMFVNARGQLHALAVYTHQRWGRCAAGRHPVRGIDHRVELLPQAQALPAVEIIADRCPGRKLRRQCPLVAARSTHVEQRVKDMA